ncbi:aminopeptidase, partial [Blautia pseudococcoides]|nr:aminopeptidase [Blautia pseudococcoides]
NGRKDISKKNSVNIRYQLGFERMIKEAVCQFEEMGLKPVIYRSAVHAVNKKQHHRIGYYGAIPNKQLDYDHKDDSALYLDQEFVQRKLRVMQVAYEQVKELANTHGGPAVIATFGEKPFTPVSKKEAFSLTPHQQRLQVNYDNEAGQIVNRYIKGEERSFTIIAYPVCEIGPQFKEIFRDTVCLNTLDYGLYQDIQQKLINALDEGCKVRIKGRGSNQTDMTVRLHELENPEKQTNFENCAADVNIPVGEVFTSPVLGGTNGVLHVSGVYLDGLYYKDLKMTFRDGKVSDYICSNFSTEEENRDYMKENILFHHDMLPLGEFAIGTNTTAYVMAKKYHIEDILPILIAEKMGPHFAVGDTCYSWSEDTAVYNPDGKEIIARDNEVSILRRIDPGRAYFGCHTDITIPYEELGEITAVKKDGSLIPIIKDSRFVLKGTEELNRVLEEL